jgi:hypothetical protein
MKHTLSNSTHFEIKCTDYGKLNARMAKERGFGWGDGLYLRGICYFFRANA